MSDLRYKFLIKESGAKCQGEFRNRNLGGLVDSASSLAEKTPSRIFSCNT